MNAFRKDKKRRSVLFLIVLLLSCSDNSKKKYSYSNSEQLKTPIVFSDSISTTNGIQFSPDGNELYVSRLISDTFDNGRNWAAIFYSTFYDEWSEFKKIDLPIDAYHPVLSVDGQKLYFNSRSHPDSANKYLKHDIWFMDRTKNGWSNPTQAFELNSKAYDSYPSITQSGNIYFNSDREGGLGGMDIYVSKFVNGKYQPPVNLRSINSTDAENDLVVDPKERFIIFNRYLAAENEISLFVSYKDGEVWSKPEFIGINKNEVWELTPSLSPDGNYFFYEIDGIIMQVDLAAIINLSDL